MQSIDEIRKGIRDQLLEEFGVQARLSQLGPMEIADWVLRRYRPPIEYEETPPDPNVQGREAFYWRIKVRTIVANEMFEYDSSVYVYEARTPESKDRLRQHIRRRLAVKVFEWLDGEG